MTTWHDDPQTLAALATIRATVHTLVDLANTYGEDFDTVTDTIAAAIYGYDQDDDDG